MNVETFLQKFQSVQSVGFTSGAFKPTLEGMRALDAAAGYPSSRLRVIHVAGTNGKGSVCSMLAAALSATGLRVGLYTSPHLLDFRERIKIIERKCEACALIPESAAREYLDRFEPDLDGRTFFEVTTGMAFWWLDRERVDVAVVEVGLGGLLDSTNIVSPELSVVTSIGLDHCAILGNTVEDIAAQKAGIFKPGVPALVGSFDERAAPVFEAAAARCPCPLFYADAFAAQWPEELHPDRLDLRGPCQEMNLTTVCACLQLLGVDLSAEVVSAICKTAAVTGLRGRWETLCGNPEVICDIGHNPPALAVNFSRLEASGRPLVIVYGIMSDKDLDGIVPLMPASARYVLVSVATSRAMDVQELRSRIGRLRPELSLTTASGVSDGLRFAMQYAASVPEALVYVGGSTFVVAEAMQAILEKNIIFVDV